MKRKRKPILNDTDKNIYSRIYSKSITKKKSITPKKHGEKYAKRNKRK